MFFLILSLNKYLLSSCYTPDSAKHWEHGSEQT